MHACVCVLSPSLPLFCFSLEQAGEAEVAQLVMKIQQVPCVCVCVRVDCIYMYRIAGNIGGNNIWRIAWKSAIGGFNFGGERDRGTTPLIADIIGGFTIGGVTLNPAIRQI